ncbi:MAG: hypothetical protein ACI4V5_00350 [Prevotella sp.]
MPFGKWADMKLMNLSTNISKQKKTIIQSLLPIPVAIVLLYIYSFKPFSVEDMENSCTLVKHTSTYRLNADGNTIAWFDLIDSDLQPQNISTYPTDNTKDSSMITACWIDKYALLPSCKGTMITNQDSIQSVRLHKLNGRIRTTIRERAVLLKKQIELLEKKNEDIEYYLSIHNVNDEGYNIIADYHNTLKKELSDSKTTLTTLENAVSARRLSIIRSENFTLLYTDTNGKVKRKTCRLITKDRTKPFCLIQTADQSLPKKAKPIHFYKWFTPTLNNGRIIIAITQPFCILENQLSEEIRNVAIIATIENKHISDMPSGVVPDGTPVFTSQGRPMGIIYKGELLSPGIFSTNYKTLLQ